MSFFILLCFFLFSTKFGPTGFSFEFSERSVGRLKKASEGWTELLALRAKVGLRLRFFIPIESPHKS